MRGGSAAPSANRNASYVGLDANQIVQQFAISLMKHAQIPGGRAEKNVVLLEECARSPPKVRGCGRARP